MFLSPSKAFRLLFIITCCCTFHSAVYAQLADSKKYLETGIERYDKGRYKDAITEFLKVPEGDTNYSLARYEAALAYLADSSYEKAIETIKDAQALHNCENWRELELLLGHAYDYMGKPDSAIAIYQRLSKLNPNDHQPIYEEGIVHARQKDIDKAIKLFEKALVINPYHYRSHLMLGSNYILQGRMTEAFIALETSLSVTNDVSLARQSILLLNDLTKQTVEVAKAYEAKKEQYKHPLFDEIDQIMNARLAANKSYKVKSVLENDNLIRVAYMVMDKLQYDQDDQNFVMQYYVPLFNDVFKKDLFDPFILHIFSDFEIEVVDKQAKKQKGDIKDLRLVVYPYLDKILATRTLSYPARIKANEKYRRFSEENIFVTGNMQTVGDKTSYKAGPAQFFKNMVLTAEGNFNDAGEKEGDWKYYFPSGKLRLKEQYVNGKIVGESVEYHKSGYPGYYVKWNSKEEKSEEKEYSYNGFLTDHKTTDANGIATLRTYFRNGQEKGTIRQKEGKIMDGSYKLYHENGKMSREITTVGGKLQGAYKDFHDNGQLEEVGNYDEGEKEGQVKIYYEDGKLSYVCNYRKGKLDGNFEDYDREGRLLSKGSYKNGLKHGLETFYAGDRNYGEIEYRNGAPIAYKFLHPDGRVIDRKEGKDLSILRTYHANGNKRSEVPLRNELYEGLAKFYFSTGALKEEINYREGLADGSSTSYYKTGTASKTFSYEKGDQTGAYIGRYANGKPQSQGALINSNKEGQWKFFHANGTIDEEGFYRDDIISGPDRQYGIDGKLIHIDYYDNGMLIGAVYYDTSGKIVSRQSFPLGNGVYKSHHLNGQVAFQCELKNGLFDGAVTRYYLNGITSEKGAMKFGKREGEFTGYHLTGVPASKGIYKNGKKEGLWSYYNDQGQLVRKMNYLNGEEHGLDETLSQGNLHSVHNMKYGYKEGDQIYYGDSTEIAIVLKYKDYDLVGYTYKGKDGAFVPTIPLQKGSGTMTAYYPNGTKSAEFKAVENVFTGKQLLYYSNGQIAVERNFENSDYNGPYKKYYEDGKLRYEAFYKDDEQLGEEKYYDRTGQIISSRNYFHDVYHGLQQVADPKTGKQTSVVYYYGKPISTQ